MSQTEQTQAVQEDDDLGVAVQLLLEDGKEEAAELLFRVLDLSYEWWDPESATAVLLVRVELLDRFTEEIQQEILKALREATRDQQRFWVSEIHVRRSLPPAEGWRERARLSFEGRGPSNQARNQVAGGSRIEHDRLVFRSQAEVVVYSALKERQAKLPILIAPNTLVRTQRNTFEVDFVVGHRGRLGVIEVDGPHHRTRWVNDRSRDRLLEDAGVMRVEHIAAEDTTSKEAVDAVLDRFLRLLEP